MGAIRVEALSYTFSGGGVRAVEEVTFALPAGELFCLLGPSGCGKSTLLRLIGGYLRPCAGRVFLDQRDVTNEPPERRQTGMVFQNYALFPHLTALDNVAFGLRVKGVGKTARLAKANETLDWVGLSKDERARRPAELSGGQQQRVALARALAFGPSLLMLDEPFANLDRLLRERLREELKQVQRRSGITTIFVTHDREEAFALGDRLAIMERGKLLQTGAPEEVYRQPAGRVVADFLGHRNLLPITAVNKTTIEAGGVSLVRPTQPARVGDYALLRPELLRLSEGGVAGTLRQRRFAGSYQSLTVELTSGAMLEVQQAHDQSEIGATVRIEIPAAAVSIVPSA